MRTRPPTTRVAVWTPRAVTIEPAAPVPGFIVCRVLGVRVGFGAGAMLWLEPLDGNGVALKVGEPVEFGEQPARVRATSRPARPRLVTRPRDRLISTGLRLEIDSQHN